MRSRSPQAQIGNREVVRLQYRDRSPPGLSRTCRPVGGCCFGSVILLSSLFLAVLCTSFLPPRSTGPARARPNPHLLSFRREERTRVERRGQMITPRPSPAHRPPEVRPVGRGVWPPVGMIMESSRRFHDCWHGVAVAHGPAIGCRPPWRRRFASRNSGIALRCVANPPIFQRFGAPFPLDSSAVVELSLKCAREYRKAESPPKRAPRGTLSRDSHARRRKKEGRKWSDRNC